MQFFSLSLLFSGVLLGFLAAFSSAAPTGCSHPQQQFAAVDNLPGPHVAKRGVQFLSPVFSRGSSSVSDETPTLTVHGPTIIPRPRYVYGSGDVPKAPWTFPWLPKEPPPGPKPKLWNPALGPEPIPGIGERLGDIPKSRSVITDPVMMMVTPSEPVVVSGTALTASQLGRKIVEQIDVECPHCGFGVDPGPSKWARFIDWVKKVWEKVKGGFGSKKAEQ